MQKDTAKRCFSVYNVQANVISVVSLDHVATKATPSPVHPSDICLLFDSYQHWGQ